MLEWRRACASESVRAALERQSKNPLLELLLSIRASGTAGAALLAVASLLSTGAVGAQTIPSPYRLVERTQEIGVFVGTANLAEGRFGFGPSGGLFGGARWGVALSGPLSFDVTAGAISGDRDVVDPSREEGERIVGQADVLMGVADARLIFTLTGDRTWNGLAPFLQAGGGLTFDLAGDDPADEAVLPEDRFDLGTSFLGTVGGGSRFYLTERLVLRGDANFALAKIDTPPGFSDPERGFEDVEESEWAGGLLLTISLAIRF